MHGNATSVVQTNGHISGPVPIHRSVRHGCPLSTFLFALCQNPLIHRLEQQLNGIRVNGRQQKTAVAAYADDVSVFVTTPKDISAKRDAIRCYERATEAVLNVSKSPALAVGTWETTRRVLDISYSAEMKVLGFNMTKTIAQLGKDNDIGSKSDAGSI